MSMTSIQARKASQLSGVAWTAAVVMTALSAMSLFFPDSFYPTRALAEAFLANDLVNILVGLPLFLGAASGLRRNKLGGYLLLPGALVYVIYNYLAYLLGLPLTWVTIPYLVLVLLSAWGLMALLRNLDHPAVKLQLEGQVAEKISGWILLLLGLGFTALAVSQIMTGIQAGSIPPLGENAVAVSDIALSFGLMSGAVLLLRRHPLGYSLGLGLLVAASSLFLGLILYFFLAPLLVGRPLDWSEVATVAGMSLIAFLPTGLFLRGTVRSEGR